jgi:hypothetical protein
MSSNTATRHGDKAMAAEMEKGMSGAEREMPPTQPSGTPVKTRRASMTLR